MPAHYRYAGNDDLEKVINQQMQSGDHIVRLYVTNKRTSRSTLLCFRAEETRGGKNVYGKTVDDPNANTTIEAGLSVNVFLDSKPIDIVVV